MPRKRPPKPRSRPKAASPKVARVPDDSLQYESGLMLLGGKPFTGVAFRSHDDEGWLEREIEYRDGVEWGWKREWGRRKKPIRESPMLRGVVHGRERTWHDNGALATEGEYEYGIALWESSWSEDGALVARVELAETHPNFALLQQLRRIYRQRP